jgi:Secretion system C-terminal sorting domain
VVEISAIENRKVITFDQGFGGGFICDSLKFIEGVGPNATLFFQSTELVEPYGFAYRVCEMYQEDTLSFPLSSEYDSCVNITSASEVLNSNDSFSIVPNPNNGSFVLKNNHPGSNLNNPLFTLFDLNGREIVSLKIDGGLPEQQVHLPHIAAGLYFYRISTNEKPVQTGKMIKKR